MMPRRTTVDNKIFICQQTAVFFIFEKTNASHGKRQHIFHTTAVQKNGKPAHSFLAHQRHQLVHDMEATRRCYDISNINYCYSYYDPYTKSNVGAVPQPRHCAMDKR